MALSFALLAALAGTALAADATTSAALAGQTENVGGGLVASVIAADATATTFFLACAPSVSADCIWPPSAVATGTHSPDKFIFDFQTTDEASGLQLLTKSRTDCAVAGDEKLDCKIQVKVVTSEGEELVNGTIQKKFDSSSEIFKSADQEASAATSSASPTSTVVGSSRTSPTGTTTSTQARTTSNAADAAATFNVGLAGVMALIGVMV